jgi:hypothetical protein
MQDVSSHCIKSELDLYKPGNIILIHWVKKYNGAYELGPSLTSGAEYSGRASYWPCKTEG